MVTAKNQATILSGKELNTRRRALPKSLYEAAGLMRHKKKALEKHIRRVRKEWDGYYERQRKIASRKPKKQVS